MLFVPKILLGILGIGLIFAFVLLGFSLFNIFYIEKRNEEKAERINEVIFTIFAYLFVSESILGGIEMVLVTIAIFLGYK